MNGNSELPESSNSQDHADTRRSLQQASVALEVAYSRIRQIRTNLLQLSESLPRPEATISRFSTSSSNVRPDHDALLLSGNLEDDSAPSHLLNGSLRSTSNMNRMAGERLVHLSGSEERLSAGGFMDANNSALRFRPLPHPNVLPPRFSRREYGSEIQFSNRRGLNADSASTTRGLRLPARGAEQDTAINLSEYAAEFDRILGRLATRENDETRSVTSEINVRDERQEGDIGSDMLGEGRRATSTTTGWRTSEARRSRRGPGIRPDVPINMRNLFEEADGRVVPDYMLMPSHSSSTERVNSPVVPRRTQVLQSRSLATPDNRLLEMNAPDDMLPPLPSAISDEEFMSWLFPTQDQLSTRDHQPVIPRYVRPQNVDSIRVTRMTDTIVSPDSPPRRGWARLDPDGNEIPIDEEDVLERSRTEYRLRALQERARQSNAASPQLNFARSGNVPGTNPQDHNGGSRRMYGTVIDSTLNIPHAPQHNTTQSPTSQQSVSSFYVDPLPMPLSSMISVPSKPEEIYVDIFVPKHSYLAGR